MKNELRPIAEIAQKLNIDKTQFENYGHYKAKLNLSLLQNPKPDGKLILVTAITPTKAGEGKSTTTISLNDGLNELGLKAVAALRQPSLGPVFGVKGAATGGGKAQVVPRDQINLHFTGDIHAIASAHNLIASLLDNHIYNKNTLQIDTKKILWKRTVDMNDRSLRSMIIGAGDALSGTMRADSFQITAASEIMSIICLAISYKNLKERLGRLVLAYNKQGQPVTLAQLVNPEGKSAVGSVAALLKEALKPNLVQTLEGNPVIMHGGPFANIAHGCNSLVATQMALKLADYTVTEAGFAADLGAEKFFNIKCRLGNLKPSAVVLVATIQALKINGYPNLDKHLENLILLGFKAVVAINQFANDTEEELQELENHCADKGFVTSRVTAFANGASGATDLAQKVVSSCQQNTRWQPLYQDSDSLQYKVEQIATQIYGANGVTFSSSAQKELAFLEQHCSHLPVCVAKTPMSLSDQAHLLGRPENFTLTINKITLSAGAGFVVMSAGSIIDMPALPQNPLAYSIDLTDEGNIVGIV